MYTALPTLLEDVISPPPHITKATGPLLLGGLINWTLYGVLITQVINTCVIFLEIDGEIGFLLFRQVVCILVIETTQTLLTGSDLFYWFVSGFGNFERLKETHLGPINTPILNTLTASIVRSSFCYRIWVIEKSLLWWCCTIMIISLAQCAGAFAGGVQGIMHGVFANAHHQNVPLVYVNLLGSTIADILVATTLGFLFARALQREIIPSMKHAIRRLLYIILETNIISASAATVTLVTFAAAPNDIYWYCPAVAIGKVYSNTLLASFNNRIPVSDSPPMSSISDTPGGSNAVQVVIQKNTARMGNLSPSLPSVDEDLKTSVVIDMTYSIKEDGLQYSLGNSPSPHEQPKEQEQQIQEGQGEGEDEKRDKGAKSRLTSYPRRSFRWSRPLSSPSSSHSRSGSGLLELVTFQPSSSVPSMYSPPWSASTSEFPPSYPREHRSIRRLPPLP
ncbi:hypothetical protein B0F90DRAFT_291348 [Multifurca ochricompacta]|uniref:DUF6534 domain-containing protein n=1 Tax=Multifurca ochricompacta TaxID=376703 RepID=A0AAD4QMM8_9AGAM|nr:hypothetical protein B0F90DRAFT_291348 [Multifurca ochricompacta]